MHLAGKVRADVANPLDFSKGMPPPLWVTNTDSLGEQIQRPFPDVRVVKAFNTITAALMLDAACIPGDHDLLMCGNEAGAKAQVTPLAKEAFGWKHMMDLGGITASRALEGYLPLWLRLRGTLKSADFNVHIVRRP